MPVIASPGRRVAGQDQIVAGTEFAGCGRLAGSCGGGLRGFVGDVLADRGLRHCWSDRENNMSMKTWSDYQLTISAGDPVLISVGFNRPLRRVNHETAGFGHGDRP
jgi:hypothetical protein